MNYLSRYLLVGKYSAVHERNRKSFINYSKLGTAAGDFKCGLKFKICSCRKQRLPFGKDFEHLVHEGSMNPHLYKLLLYLYVNGSNICQLLPLTKVDRQEVHELKKKLKRSKNITMCKYSVSATLGVLEKLLKQLPKPLLHKDKWQWLAEDLRMVDNVSMFAALEEKCKAQIDEMTSEQRILIYHLFVVLYQMATESRRLCPNPTRLQTILFFLGPSMLRNKKGANALSHEDLSLLQFMVNRCIHIFGDHVLLLFPNRSTIGIRNTYEVSRCSMIEDWLRFMLSQSLHSTSRTTGSHESSFEVSL